MDRGAWRALVHGGHKESDMTEQLTHISLQQVFIIFYVVANLVHLHKLLFLSWPSLP